MKIGVSKEITPDKLLVAKKLGLQGLLFTRISQHVSLSELSNYKIINITAYYPDAMWYAYEKIIQQLNKIKTKIPHFFFYKEYDLFHAFCKDLYWTFIYESIIEYSREHLAENNSFFMIDRPRPARSLVKFLYLFFMHSRSKTHIELENKNGKNVCGKLALRVNSLDILPMYGYLLDTLGHDNIVTFQSNFSDNRTFEKTLEDNFFLNYSLSDTKKKDDCNSLQDFIGLFISGNLEFASQLISSRTKLIHHIKNYEWMAKRGVAGFLIDAGENDGEGYVMGSVAEKFNIKSYNYMNGTKAKEPVNQATFFDYWFMHDTEMRKMLMSYSNLKAENLPVTGHLLEDVAAQHVYSGTLDPWLINAQNKKIISLFTTFPLFNKEKIDVCDFLETLVNQNPDILVLIRKHPSDLSSLSFKSDNIIILPHFNEKSRDNLFDLLLRSHIAISFASTVSYQASWFSLPSVSFEYAETSILTYIDSHKIFHINSIELLDKFISNVFSNVSNVKKPEPPDKPVALRIAEIICSEKINKNRHDPTFCS